jgi:hypothetical protein
MTSHLSYHVKAVGRANFLGETGSHKESSQI